MKYSLTDAKSLIQFIYGLTDYKIPENILTKAIFFYRSDVEKEILKKNGVYCLDKDCSKEDIQDLLNNKVLSEKYIALHSEDLKLYIFLLELNFISIILTSEMTPDVFGSLGLIPKIDDHYNLNDSEKKHLLTVFAECAKDYKYVALGDKFYLCYNDDPNLIIDDNLINNIKSTKYNVMNIFSERADKIMTLFKNARSNN